ncbi:MAG: hypothetical protein JOZ32_17970, partial [Bryobacterales bacterium]|nr:hypothetical protein [Bryobacterales bacterium]
NDPLSDYLTTGYSCSIGDKTFSNFTYTSSAQGDATLINASGISVSTLDSASPLDPNGDIGLGFTASWVASGADAFTDSVIGFTVTVAPNAGMLIKDTAVAQTSGVSGSGIASVAEVACGPAPCNLSDPWSTITFDSSSAYNGYADTGFSPISSIEVSKDISASTTAAGDLAHLSFVADTFSQTATPEPRALSLLLTLGLVAGFAFRKKLQGVRA